MPRKTCIALLATGALAACGGDNPENVPLYGQWEMTTRIDSLTLDGMLVPPEAMPPEFTRLTGTESICGEPMFIDREWQLADINSQVDGECTLDSYEVTQTAVDGAGVCDLSQGGQEFRPRYTVRISQQPDSYRMVIAMEGSLILPEDGSPHTVRVVAIQEGERTGDC